MTNEIITCILFYGGVYIVLPLAGIGLAYLLAHFTLNYTPVCSDYAPVVVVPAVELVHEMILVQHESGKMPVEFDCLPGQAQEMSDFLNDLGYFTFVADGLEYQEIWKRLSANRVYGKVFYAPGADTCAVCGSTQDLVVDGYLPVNSRLCFRCAIRHFDLVEKDLETFRDIATSI